MAERKLVRTVAIQVCIDTDGEAAYVVSDEESFFAESTTITDALRYVSNLLYGPGTGPRGFVWHALASIERARALRDAKNDASSEAAR